MEGDLDELAVKIFSGECLLPRSVQIQGSFETVKDLFEALLMLFTKGMKILYGDENGHVKLEYLTSVQFKEFRTRFWGLGINPIVKQYHLSDILKLQGIPVSDALIQEKLDNPDKFPHAIILSDLTDYQSIKFDNLQEGRFQLRCENIYYILQFNTAIEK